MNAETFVILNDLYTDIIDKEALYEVILECETRFALEETVLEFLHGSLTSIHSYKTIINKQEYISFSRIIAIRLNDLPKIKELRDQVREMQDNINNKLARRDDIYHGVRSSSEELKLINAEMEDLKLECDLAIERVRNHYFALQDEVMEKREELLGNMWDIADRLSTYNEDEVTRLRELEGKSY